MIEQLQRLIAAPPQRADYSRETPGIGRWNRDIDVVIGGQFLFQRIPALEHAVANAGLFQFAGQRL